MAELIGGFVIVALVQILVAYSLWQRIKGMRNEDGNSYTEKNHEDQSALS
ncbi:hypothetical protein OAF74_01295 [bacterium]|jgi:hypothetical protein|nr:hypothetical protein [Planctomicrobium sp.]MDB4731449.1 hypothetical protein [bacterium]